MRRLTRTFALLVALLLGAACSVLVACGGSGSDAGLIPDQQAATMIDQLDTIQSSVSRGRCSGVDSQVASLQTQINDLSRRVDADLRARLQEGVDNLASIAPDECFQRRAGQQTQTETTTTETVPTQTIETTTTETTTDRDGADDAHDHADHTDDDPDHPAGDHARRPAGRRHRSRRRRHG